jgi:hypothetical protein
MPAKRRDPFVRALEWIMHERDLDAKGLSLISSVNDQTIRKLLRESAGSNKMRDKIARALGFKSFADVYQIGLDQEKPKPKPQEEAELKLIIEHLDRIENKFDADIRNLRNQIDLLTQAVMDRPFGHGTTINRKKAN